MKFKIDREMLPMKAHYFFFNAGTSPAVPFMPTLIRQLGFSSFIVGTIYTILPVIGLLAKPIFGAIADRFQLQRMLFLVFQILTAVAFFGINFIPQVERTTSLEFHCNNGIGIFHYCPNGTELDNCLVNDLTKDWPDNSSNVFNCHFTCQVSEDWMLNLICDKWQNNTNCDSNRKEFTMQTKNNLNHFEHVEQKCLHFRPTHTEMIDGGTLYPIICPERLNTSLDFNIQCDGSCDNELVMRTISDSKISNNNVVKMLEFWLLLLFLSLSWAGMAVVVSVGDAICFSLLGERSYLYGNQRLWGSVGWGVFSLIAGVLVDKFSGNNVNKNYSVVFYMVIILIGCDFWFSLKIKNVQTQRSKTMMRDLGVLFLSLPVLVFFIWCIVIGLCTALIWNFLFWHLETLADEGCNQTTWMKTLQGLAMGIQCFGGELPFFFLSGWILRKIGHINAMSLVLIGLGVRFLLYSVLSNPWWVLPIELLNGITFGLFYSTMASYASIVAPLGTEATLQGLVGAIFEGIGVSTGSFIGGIMFDKIGGSATFRLYGISVLVFCAIHVAVQKLIQRYDRGHDMNKSTTATLLHTENAEASVILTLERESILVCCLDGTNKQLDNETDLRFLPEYSQNRTATSAYYKTPNDALNMLEDEDHLPDNT